MWKNHPFEIVDTGLPYTWHHDGDDWPIQVNADGIVIYGCCTQAHAKNFIKKCQRLCDLHNQGSDIFTYKSKYIDHGPGQFLPGFWTHSYGLVRK